MRFSTGRVTDTLLTIVTASLVVLGVASTQAGSSAPAPVSAVAITLAPVDPKPVTAVSPVSPMSPVSPAAAGPVLVPAAASLTAAGHPAASRTVLRAAAADPSRCSGAGWQERRGEAALASLRPAQSPGYPVTFKPAMKGFYGLTKPAQLVIEVYVRDCAAESDALLRHVVAHEIGHARDRTWLTEAQRTTWLAARGIPAGTPWQGCNRCTDFATPAGDFAEVYAQWRRGASDNRSQLAGAPAPAALDALARQFFGA